MSCFEAVLIVEGVVLTLLSFGWMGMGCWLRWELPGCTFLKNVPHFPCGMSERWRDLQYQWRLAHQIAAEHQRSWFTPVKVPEKWQYERLLSSFIWYAYNYHHYSRWMIYQSLMEKIKLWKGLFPLVVWSVDGVTVTHACFCLKCFDIWGYFLLTLFFFLHFFSPCLIVCVEFVGHALDGAVGKLRPSLLSD